MSGGCRRRGDRLRRVLGYMLNEAEFLSPHGVRAPSAYHREHPHVAGQRPRLSTTSSATDHGDLRRQLELARAGVLSSVNYLLIESPRNFHHYFGDSHGGVPTARAA